MPSPFSSPLLLVSLLLVPLLLPTHLLARPDGGHQHLNKDGAHKEGAHKVGAHKEGAHKEGAHRGAHKKSAHRSAEIPIEEYEVGMKLCYRHRHFVYKFIHPYNFNNHNLVNKVTTTIIL